MRWVTFWFMLVVAQRYIILGQGHPPYSCYSLRKAVLYTVINSVKQRSARQKCKSAFANYIGNKLLRTNSIN